MLTVIIPSYNEENYIGPCLEAIAAQSGLPAKHGCQVIVAANGCRDHTVARARAKETALAEAGFDLRVMDIARGNKINALNEAEKLARFDTRVFIDADVQISPAMLAQLHAALAVDSPRYASGTLRIPRPQSLITRAYAKVWMNMPFVRDGVPGAGLYAVNAAGRARWGTFPAIYGDDLFVRLQFTAEERTKVPAPFDWPLPEGFANLVHVRHRWAKGNTELADRFPELAANESEVNTSASSALRLLKTPFASVVFVLVHLVSKFRARQAGAAGGFDWQRGRT